MRLIILVAAIALASANEEDVKDKRQVLLGGLGYGGLAYGGLGYGLGYPYGYGLGGYPAVIGRKRREAAEETDETIKEKRQLLLGGLGYGGLAYGGLGYGLGYPYGYGLGGYPAVIGRKRRDVAEETDEATKEKRQLLLGGYGLGLGYGGLGYGLGYPYGYGLGGFPAVIGRKRRNVEETDEATKEKRQLLLGGYGLGLGYGGFGYGLPYGYGLGGYPAVIGRKRRDVEETADKAAHEKRQVLLGAGAIPVGGVYPGALPGVLPVGGVVGAYPGVIGAYPGVVGAPGVIL